MTKMTIFEFKMDGISSPALEVFKAAVMHAQKNRCIRLHTMSITEFCRLAGLPGKSSSDIRMILKEARRVLAVVEVVDTSLPNRDDLPYSSWPVFSKALIDDSSVLFEICHRTFDERLLSRLPS